jgi:hypothetical protein
MADGPPETAPNCEALILKAKATEGERIRTSRSYPGESQRPHRGRASASRRLPAPLPPCCTIESCGHPPVESAEQGSNG